MNLSPQYFSIFLVFGICIITMIIIGKALNKRTTIRINSNKDNLMELFFSSFESIVEGVLGEKYVTKFTPLAILIFTTLFLTNIVGLIGLKEGAYLNPIYTFTWSIAMFIFWNIYGIYIIGIKAFLSDFTNPFAFMLPLQIIGFLTKPISMGARLVGNISAGAIFLGLYWSVPAMIMNINFFAGLATIPIFVYLGAFLSLYFALFGPFIQALVFTYLTLVNLGSLIIEE